MLANKEKGEVSVVVEGRRYVLSVVSESMLELEDLTGRSFIESWEGIAAHKSMHDVCRVLWTGLRAHHPEIATDGPEAMKQIARFIDRAGGLKAMIGTITALVQLHLQPTELQDAGGTGARPLDAAASPASPGDASASPGSVAA